MTEPSSEFKLNPRKLGRLLNICQEPDLSHEPGSPESEKARLLRDCLADIPALRADVVDKLPTMIKHMVQELPRLKGIPLAQLLADTNTSLEALEAIKRCRETLSIPVDRGVIRRRLS